MVKNPVVLKRWGYPKPTLILMYGDVSAIWVIPDGVEFQTDDAKLIVRTTDGTEISCDDSEENRLALGVDLSVGAPPRAAVSATPTDLRASALEMNNGDSPRQDESSPARGGCQ